MLHRSNTSLRRACRVAVLAAACLALASVARAEGFGFLSPSIGFNFGNAFADCASLSNCQAKRAVYGVGLGYLGSVLGFEEEVTYTPAFFAAGADASVNSVTTVMSNLLVTAPTGPVNVYGTVGLGVIRSAADFDLAQTFRNLNLGWVLGGGVMVLPVSHLGVRFDIRHYRGTGDINTAGLALTGSPLNFSRVTAAAVVRF